ncbi:hypothetical protein [Glaciecola sp. 1036]|uniref:hypothetical protein n=1 Tax=Alteromonadaceae TaxID=72275 RepID=UPI003CFF9E1D
MKSSEIEKSFGSTFDHWYFPLQASFPQFLNEYLDSFIGTNPHFDMVQREAFVESVFHSFSLSISEKKRVLREYSNLSQFQLDELLKVFIEETKKFQQLEVEHPHDVSKLKLNRGLDWIFILENIDYSVAVLDLAYKADLTFVATYCLQKLEQQDLTKEYILVFESVKDAVKLSTFQWNYYLHCLSEQNALETLKYVTIPEAKKTPFLDAVRGSYVLKKFNFRKFPEKLLTPVFNLIKSKETDLVKNQFLDDLKFYYLFKTRNLNKFFIRSIKLFLSSYKKSIFDVKRDFTWFQKSFMYIFPIYVHLSPGDLRYILHFLHQALVRQLDAAEHKMGDVALRSFYDENADYILSLATTLLLTPNNQHQYFEIINKHPRLKESSEVFANILLQTNQMLDPAFLEYSIDYYINDKKDNIRNQYYLYQSLLVVDKPSAASYVLGKIRTNKYAYELPETLAALNTNTFTSTVDYGIYSKCIGNLKAEIETCKKKTCLDLSFQEYLAKAEENGDDHRSE